ncbi:MAG: hypothetical protein PHE49_06785 [bacterium]|nr:hypothetical protein [bacterium]
MGTYIASPWGSIRGKLKDAVGGACRGIDWVRERVYPTQHGTLEMYKQLKKGLITPDRFSYKQMNIRRLVFQQLGYTGRTNRGNLMTPIWKPLCAKRHLPITAINMFVKRSAPDLWDSIPNPDEEYNASTNCPDMTKMVVSDGDLEPISDFTVCSYNAVTGDVTFGWDTTTIKNGKSDDYVFTFVFNKPVIDSKWRPNGYLYGDAKLLPPVKRMDGIATFSIAAGLTASELTGYIFCRDKKGEIGFSPSKGKQIS